MSAPVRRMWLLSVCLTLTACSTAATAPPPKPEPRAWSDTRDEFTCEGVTQSSAEGFYDLSFDRHTNTWVEDDQPTIVSEASSFRLPTPDELAAHGCPPLDAE